VPALSSLELLALLALARLRDEAYGVTVQQDISRVIGREVSMAAVYAALDRLERQGLVRPWQSAPRPERGGRTRRHFALSRAGHAALRAERATMSRMWHDVTLRGEGK